jgi:hypothetical protein
MALSLEMLHQYLESESNIRKTGISEYLKDFKGTGYKSERAGIREWLERYTLERRISSTERVKDIGGTRFYMKLEPKLVDGDSLWEVSILYHPRRYSKL